MSIALTGLVLLVALAFEMRPAPVAAQVSTVTIGVPYTQSFDTLPASGSATWTNNSNIPGWFHARTGTGTTIVANDGSSNAGNLYSYGTGTATDRALGSVGSGNAAVGNLFWGVRLQNNTGSTITQLDISYTGEQWRNSAAAAQTIAFSYLVGSPTVTGSLAEFQSAGVAVPQLDFTSPITGGTAGALNGNLAANRVTLTHSITGLSIPNGTEVMLRWSDPDHTGADHGLSIDDFSVTPQGGTPTPTLNISDVTLAEGDPPGTTTFTFAVTLTAPAGLGGVTFDIATADGTAQDGNPGGEDNDYVAQSLTGQSISAGSTGPYNFSVTVNRDTTVEPNETFFVNVTNITGANAGDTQGQGTINNDDVAITPIHDIQGPGASSPIVGASVTTRGVVTGVKSNGFFIQEPDASVDADPATSEGIFVFTSSAPPAAAVVGNYVQVTGTVAEFVPSQDTLQPPLTELTSPTTVQLSSGNPLPAAIPLTATFPDPAGAHDQLERLEGMRASAASLTVVGPTLGNVNEANATATSTGVFYGVVTGVARPFREAGIPAPDPAPSGGGTIPPIPRFDSNPERIRVDSDELTGTTALDVRTGALVTGLVGPLDYTFRSYTILPDPGATIAVDNTNAIAPTAVATPMANEFTVASYNLERFFDTVNDPSIGEPVLTSTAYNNRLNKASLGIRNYLRFPDIIGIVEAENITVLQDLAARISSDAIANSQPDPMYQAYLVEGNDVGGIDVGFLVKTSVVTGMTPRVSVTSVTQENAGELFVNPNATTELLNDRPPLRLNATINFPTTSFAVTVIVNHMRSLNGVNSESAGSNGWATEGARVRAKRLKQAESLANLVQARQTADPTERIILVGDFNAFEVNDGLVDSMNVIQGTPPPDNETAVPGDGVDLVNPDLTNLFNTAPASERYSFIFDGNAQSLDHIVVNQSLISSTTFRRVEHPRINADFPETARNNVTSMEMNVERLADHDPIVGFFTVTIPCALTCPMNVSVSNGKGQCGATVTFDSPTTSGDCGTIVCTPSSGSFFPIGTTTVTCTNQTMTQNGSFSTQVVNPGQCSFTVTVTDDEDPVISCPMNITRTEQKTGAGVVVTYTPTATDNTDSCKPAGTTSVTCMPPSGSTFYAGTTTVTCTATDPSKNTDECSFTVTVNEGNNCTITCPKDVTTNNTTGQCGAVVNYDSPTTTGDCGKVTCNPSSGSFFAVGTTTVTCTASAGPSCTFTVTVNNTQPIIACPMNVTTNNTTGQCGAAVNYPSPTLNPCFKGTVGCSPPPNSFFPVGTTTVTCTADDGSRQTTCTFTVRVNDTEGPTFSNCPAGVTAVAQVACPMPTSAVVTYATPTATDNCGSASVSCSPPSGSTLPAGTTTVTCTATDATGNSSTCSFPVKVFTGCLQDISKPGNVVLFNHLTGEYRFCCNGTVVASGVGVLQPQGCTFTIQHNTTAVRVLIKVNASGKNGTASIQKPVGTAKCDIIDKNTADNLCNCQ